MYEYIEVRFSILIKIPYKIHLLKTKIEIKHGRGGESKNLPTRIQIKAQTSEAILGIEEALCNLV